MISCVIACSVLFSVALIYRSEIKLHCLRQIPPATGNTLSNLKGRLHIDDNMFTTGLIVDKRIELLVCQTRINGIDDLERGLP